MTPARITFLLIAMCFAIPILATAGTITTAKSNAMENTRMTHESVVDFLKNFEALAQKKNFDLVADMVHERAVFRFNDGDFVGRAAVRAAFEKTWASSSGKPEQEKFYLSDVVVIATDTNTAAATYNWNWEGVSQGKSFRIQGRGTRVLVREGGQWQIIHEHLSRMPKP
jgi:ketosteroid isomerase-like protein